MIDIRVEIFYRSLTDLPKKFLIITENIFFVKPFTDGGPSCRLLGDLISALLGHEHRRTLILIQWVENPVSAVYFHLFVLSF